MIHPQFIKTPEGGELVVLARAEFDALIAAAREAEEDRADQAAYDAAKADLAGSTPLPAAVSAHMLKGDSLLRALRKWRGLTQMELSARAGIGQGYLSDLEAREKTGARETLQRLAAALEVDPGWLAGR